VLISLWWKARVRIIALGTSSSLLLVLISTNLLRLVSLQHLGQTRNEKQPVCSQQLTPLPQQDRQWRAEQWAPAHPKSEKHQHQPALLIS
jgi:hypothetical protein